MVQLDIDGHLGIARFGARFGQAEAMAAVSQVATASDFLDCATYLWDFTRTDIVLDTAEIQAVAEAYRKCLPAPPRRRKIALVANTPATRAKLMIIRSLLDRADRAEFQLFEREPAARLWLAVRPQWTNKYAVPGVQQASA